MRLYPSIGKTRACESEDVRCRSEEHMRENDTQGRLQRKFMPPRRCERPDPNYQVILEATALLPCGRKLKLHLWSLHIDVPVLGSAYEVAHAFSRMPSTALVQGKSCLRMFVTRTPAAHSSPSCCVRERSDVQKKRVLPCQDMHRTEGTTEQNRGRVSFLYFSLTFGII